MTTFIRNSSALLEAKNAIKKLQASIKAATVNGDLKITEAVAKDFKAILDLFNRSDETTKLFITNHISQLYGKVFGSSNTVFEKLLKLVTNDQNWYHFFPDDKKGAQTQEDLVAQNVDRQTDLLEIFGGKYSGHRISVPSVSSASEEGNNKTVTTVPCRH